MKVCQSVSVAGDDVDESLDCLFLDIYVPAAAVENPSLKLPVISWFYGGAFIFGGKDSFGDVLPLYDGTGLLQESGGNVIFVASNYRVGAPFLGMFAPVISDEKAARCLWLACRYDHGI